MDAKGIVLDKVSLRYGDQSILEDITLTIEEGEFVCLVGPSGAGKDSLVRLLAGLTLPTTGAVYINGEKVMGPGLDRGVVFQDYTLFPWMSAGDNIVLALRQAFPHIKVRQLKEVAEEFLDLVGLNQAFHKLPSRMSGGMRQRARARAASRRLSSPGRSRGRTGRRWCSPDCGRAGAAPTGRCCGRSPSLRRRRMRRCGRCMNGCPWFWRRMLGRYGWARRRVRRPICCVSVRGRVPRLAGRHRGEQRAERSGGAVGAVGSVTKATAVAGSEAAGSVIRQSHQRRQPLPRQHAQHRGVDQQHGRGERRYAAMECPPPAACPAIPTATRLGTIPRPKQTMAAAPVRGPAVAAAAASAA